MYLLKGIKEIETHFALGCSLYMFNSILNCNIKTK